MALDLKRKRDKDVTGSRAEKRLHLAPEAEGEDVIMSGDGGGLDEEEEWGGVALEQEETEENAHGPGTKPKKPPTGEELRDIKEASELFRSSTFKLQIDALLPNVRPKQSRTPPLDRFLLSLHAFLVALPAGKPQHPLDAARALEKKGVAVPYALPLPTKETNWTVSFQTPSDITLVGSWANKTSVKGTDGIKFGVDLAVEMPSDLFQEKDYLNGRFFQKRAYYLASIAAAIQKPKSALNIDVSYQSTSADPRLTTLLLTSRKDDTASDFTKLNACVRILLVLPESSPISLHRLSPSHSNIRASSTDDAQSPATPLYNTAMLVSTTPRPHLLATHTVKESTPAFSDALTLLRVWANQRGYGDGTRLCVRGFEGKGPFWNALLILLIGGEEPVAADFGKPNQGRRKALGRGLSSYQLFRAALDFLAKHKFESQPVLLKTKEGNRFDSAEYRAHHDAVLVDSTSTLNLLAGVPLSSLDTLKHDAKKTLELLDQSTNASDHFTEVLLKDQRDLPTRFDAVIRVDLSSAAQKKPSVYAALDSGSSANALLASINSLLRQGLGDRTTAIAILQPTSQPRPVSEGQPSHPSAIQVGLVFDPEHAFRLVDHGPAADDPDPTVADAFRELWGDKAELRRFKDGRIVESVVWDVASSDERAHVPIMVVQHILSHHFGLEASAMHVWQSSFDGTVRLPEAIARLYQTSGAATGFKAAMTAFDDLVKGLKAVDDDLPLALLNISPVSEYLRYTSTFTPVPLPVSAAAMMPQSARYLPVMEIVLEFEKSSRWPDDLKAIQKLKLAFFERIAEVLMAAMKGYKATVVVGDGVQRSEIADQAYLEIVSPQGWAFVARIWHDRESTLLEQIVDVKSRAMQHIAVKQPDETTGKERVEALEAIEVHTRRFVHAPRHHRAIAALSHHFPAFAGTVRLVKRWLAAHWLLHAHISEEVVEIICASVFVRDGKVLDTEEPTRSRGASVPSTKERGFAVVVEFFKSWKWEEGLFIPLYGSVESGNSSAMPPPAILAGKAGVWTVSTEADRAGRVWTSRGPDTMIAHRVRAIAQATWQHMQGIEDGTLDVKGLFIHPIDDYDFIVRLEPAVLPRYFQNVSPDPGAFTKKGKYANLVQGDEAALRPGFDPARLFFNDLQRVYPDTLKLFFDPFGGDRIGVVWDSTLKSSRPFRALGGFSSIPSTKKDDKSKDKSMVVLNESAVLAEIQRIGLGLVKSIDVQSA